MMAAVQSTKGDLMSDPIQAASTPIQPPPLPVQTLGYATPFGTGVTTGGMWREASKLVTTTLATLPPRCVKCNEPGEVEYRDRTFYWSSPWLLFTILAGILIYAIIALVTRKKVVLSYHLCRTHHRRRVRLIAMTYVLCLLGVIVMIAGPIYGSEVRNDAIVIVGLLGGPGMLIGSIITGMAARALVPTRITDQYGWFNGCCPEFLAELPSTV
jgi:hypothetical protein